MLWHLVTLIFFIQRYSRESFKNFKPYDCNKYSLNIYKVTIPLIHSVSFYPHVILWINIILNLQVRTWRHKLKVTNKVGKTTLKPEYWFILQIFWFPLMKLFLTAQNVKKNSNTKKSCIPLPGNTKVIKISKTNFFSAFLIQHFLALKEWLFTMYL